MTKNTLYITMTDGSVQSAEYEDFWFSDGPEVLANGDLKVKSNRSNVAYFPSGTWVTYSNSNDRKTGYGEVESAIANIARTTINALKEQRRLKKQTSATDADQHAS
jgi:hypothetical protein